MSEKAFTETTEKVKLNNGEEIVLPRLVIGRIMVLTDAMNELITAAKEKAPVVFDLFSGKDGTTSTDVVAAIPQLIPLFLGQTTKVLSLYIDRDEDWIKENMDLEDLVAVATPFFVNISKQANYILKPIVEAMKKAQAQVDQAKSPSKKQSQT